MKKVIFILAFISIFASEIFAQSFYAIKRDRKFIASVGTGTSSYYGELSNDNDYLDAKPNFNVGFQYYLTNRISARAEVTWFQLSGDDAQADDPGRVKRNLSFVSNNYEINVAGIVNLFPKGQRYYQRKPFNVYGFIGIGITYFNPKAIAPDDYNGSPLSEAGTKVALRPLQTEGVAYSRFTPVIPFGIGVKAKVGPFFNVAIEAGWRKTFTDYLDDASSVYPDYSTLDSDLARAMSSRAGEIEGQEDRPIGAIRGNTDKKDAYSIINLKVEYFISPLGIFAGNNSYGSKKKYKAKKRRRR